MKLFDLEKDELPKLSTEARTIKEFKTLILKDKSKGKEKALKELAFIYFYCTWDSRFDMYKDGSKEKEDAIKKCVDLPKDWKVNEHVQAAIDRYKNMITTPSSKLVSKAKVAIEKLEDFIDTVDLNERTKSDGLVFSPLDLQKVIMSMTPTIEALQKADDLVRKELSDRSNEDKKGRRINLINREPVVPEGEI